MICSKSTAVLNIAIIGGPFVEVCNDCLKYGKKVDFCNVDIEMGHCELIEVVDIRQKK